MREITFGITLRDWQEGFRMGLSHMTSVGRAFWVTLILVMTVGLALVLVSTDAAVARLPTPVTLRSLLCEVGVLAALMLAAYVSDLVVIGYLFRKLTVQLLPQQFVLRGPALPMRIRWKDVTAVIDTGEHLCFCQNYPCATVIPKAAFPNPEQACAFLEQAEHYWRRETGRKERPPLDASGVWPPAPRAQDSQELGENRRR